MNYLNGVTYEEIRKPDIKNIVKKPEKKEVKKKSADDVIYGMNFDTNIVIPYEDTPISESKSTPAKRNTNNTKTVSTGVVPVENNNKYSATEAYMDKYQETNTLLKTAIGQLDIGLGEMQSDMNMLRANKTLRNKYQTMSMIQKNMGDFLGNKINAIKELNNVISKCNDLELKRAKELKEIENQDDDKRIMDLYNSMISMPIGGQMSTPNGFSSPLGPNTFDMTYAGNPNTSIPNIVTSIDGNDDAGFQLYKQNRTPAQNMMFLDTNPNAKQVVVHNRNTGETYFEIMDMSTMTPIPNVEKYDNSFLEDTHLDFINGIATNVNIGESYPIIQIGNDMILNEY